MIPIDDATRREVSAALTRARAQGRDEVEYLNSYGLLATRHWRNMVRVEAITEVIEILERANVAGLAGHAYATGSWTAADILRGVLSLLGRLRERIKREQG